MTAPLVYIGGVREYRAVNSKKVQLFLLDLR